MEFTDPAGYERVLDIGCGWGGLALDLARAHDANVLGVTLSTEQLSTANNRAYAAGLSGKETAVIYEQ